MNPTKKKISFDKFNHPETIEIRTESDQCPCCITGCAVLSYKTIVLADYLNKKLKVVDISRKTVIQEKSIDSNPGFIARMFEDKIAVTFPVKREIRIFTTGSQLLIVFTVPVKGQCKGITFHENDLYVLCVDPVCVLVLDKQGNVKNKIPLNTENFSDPHFLLLSENSKLIYISDQDKDSVISITLQGEVMDVYKDTDLEGPLGMLMLDDGSMIVCCFVGNIYHISGDMKQGQTTVYGLNNPYSICYNHQLHEVYIGSDDCDHLTMLSPQYSFDTFEN